MPKLIATHEVDDVARGAAAEAVEPVGDPVDGHGRGRVVVERAARHEPFAPRVERHPGFGDDVGDRVPDPDLGDVDPWPRGGAHNSIPRSATAGAIAVAGMTTRCLLVSRSAAQAWTSWMNWRGSR